MCAYCMIADWAHKHLPYDPGPVYPTPTVPFQPVPNTYPWTRPMLNEFEDLLRRVKALEEKVDPCPCPDESKMDFIKAIHDKLDAIEKAQKGYQG